MGEQNDFMKETLSSELEKIKSYGLYRELRSISSAPEKEIVIDGKSFINYSSNNYLGLANHPEVKKSAISAIEKYGCGGTSSRLIAGTLDLHKELEDKLAKFKNKDAALVFPSGYQTNAGVISTLIGRDSCIIMDRLNHASLWDAAKISGSRVFVYPHRDMNALEKVLVRVKSYRRKLIVTDSVFSMDGDLASLKEIVYLAKKYNSWTMIDEAHATGIFGENGAGLACHFGIEKEIDIIMGTLSKALGSQGGFVCGSKEMIDYLINKSRSFIYTTAIAPSCAGAALSAINLIEKEPFRRQKLLDMSRKLRERLNSIGFNTLNSESQIIPFFVGPITETESIAAKLMRDGIFAPAIRPPTVAEGQCRLRFSLTADHTDSDLNKLFESLVE